LRVALLCACQNRGGVGILRALRKTKAKKGGGEEGGGNSFVVKFVLPVSLDPQGELPLQKIDGKGREQRGNICETLI